MVKKSGRSKLSSIKKSNQRQNKLQRQGKLKKKHNRKKIKTIKRRRLPSKNNTVNLNEEKTVEEEESELHELETNFSTSSYSFLAYAQLTSNGSSRRRKRKLQDLDELDPIELKFQQSLEESEAKKVKYLLPIKTTEGLVTRSVEVDENEDEENEKDVKAEDKEPLIFPSEEHVKKEYSNADLLAHREKSLKQKKFTIGDLCSGLLESPEEKINNFKPLLDMLSTTDPEICITVKKLALISLLEVFKDILPDYQIKIHDDPKVKLKKEVKLLRDYESNLLRFYKNYLQKIENIISLFKKKGFKLSAAEPQINLALMALKCLCDLLVAYPYFNYSRNIVHLIIRFLNSRMEKVREMVSSAIKEIFRTDTRGELSLHIVRAINLFVKSKKYAVHPETLHVFLSLRLIDINLDKEKEDELQKKKLVSKKHKLLQLSKRERKRKKKLQDLEKELLETKASESKERKHQYLTEITKLVFMIYFKILKVTPSTKLLKVALEGLAKFAHCINVDFYHDLVNVLDNLIETENLGFKEKLCCVHTVFTILFYQGATIYLDPSRFYSHLYANIVHINAGKSHSDMPLVLKAVDVVLLKRRKYVSLQRLLAFTKRLSLLTLQVLPNGSLSLLSIIKEILQVNSSTDVLMDVDSTIGQGVYYPEMDEPEYCNAGVSSLWEFLPLQRHYHPTVQEFAKIVVETDHSELKSSQFKNFLKSSSEELFKEYDASEVRFNPSVPAPRKFPRKKNIKFILNETLEDFIKCKLCENDICTQIMDN